MKKQKGQNYTKIDKILLYTHWKFDVLIGA